MQIIQADLKAERKQFFFAKKNQNTFAILPASIAVDRSAAKKDFFLKKEAKTFDDWRTRRSNANRLKSKVFWFFFAKKNAFLLCPWPLFGSIAAGALVWNPAAAQTQDDASATARRTMAAVYEDFCLNRFTNPANLKAEIAARKLPQAGPAEATAALRGRAGQVYVVAQKGLRFLLAVADGPNRACAVTGTAPEDAAMHAMFDVMITMYAGEHELGALVKPPVRNGTVGSQKASLQLIGAAPDGQPRQAFVNIGMANADGTTNARMTRELAPPAAATPAPQPAAPKPAAPPAPKP